MDSITLFRQQLKEAHEWLEMVMQGITPEQLHWKPPGKANPISACYAHVIIGEDFLVTAMLKGGPPMAMTSWAGKTGLSEMAPADPQINWFEWGRKVKVDLPAIRKYAQAVWSNSDSYLASRSRSGNNISPYSRQSGPTLIPTWLPLKRATSRESATPLWDPRPSYGF